MDEPSDNLFVEISHAETLMNKMQEFFQNQQLCDVVLCIEGVRIPAHRIILSTTSDYFTAMFMNDMVEATQHEVSLKDVDPDAMKELVKFMYIGKLEIREDNVETLMRTACLLQLSTVVTACSVFMQKQLHPSNCIGIRHFADTQGCSVLYQQAHQYIVENFEKIIINHEFLHLSPQDIVDLFKDEYLNVSDESVIFHSLVHWTNKDPASRSPHLPELLSYVKLPLLSPEFLTDHVEMNNLFKDKCFCQELIFEAMKYHLLPERRSHMQNWRTKPRRSTSGTLYAVGSMECSKGVITVDRYDLRTDQWEEYDQMVGRRLQFGLAIIQDILFIVGGRDGLKSLSVVECFDPRKKSWYQGSPMMTHRHGLGVAVLEGPMYAVGGHDGWSYLNTVERWDPQSKQWCYVAPMSTHRCTVGVAVLANKLYAVGGRDGSSCLRSVECFDPHTNKWTLCSPMSRRRGGVGVASSDGFLYAVGGHDAPASNPKSSRFDSVERYDPKTDQWTLVSPITSPRDAVAMCLFGDRLFAVGGCDGQHYLGDVESYDPQANVWKSEKALRTGRAGACVVHIPSKKHHPTSYQQIFSSPS